jgi:hypothetical protein
MFSIPMPEPSARGPVHHKAFHIGMVACLRDSTDALSAGKSEREMKMKRVLILAVGLALAGTSAWGQNASRDRDDFNRGGWRESRDGWDRDRDRRHGPGMRDDDEDEDRGSRSGGGARFFLRSGDTQLRVTCGDRESTQSCVDAALRMFDRLQSQQGTTNRPSGAPAQPPQ